MPLKKDEDDTEVSASNSHPLSQLTEITDLSGIYSPRNISPIQICIPLLIISFLYAVYTYGGITPLYPPITEDPIWLVLSIFAVGLIAPDEFEGARFV